MWDILLIDHAWVKGRVASRCIVHACCAPNMYLFLSTITYYAHVALHGNGQAKQMMLVDLSDPCTV